MGAGFGTFRWNKLYHTTDAWQSQGLSIGFEAANGKVYREEAGGDDKYPELAGWSIWSWGWDRPAPARQTTTRYWTVEAPANAFTSGKFAVMKDGALQWYFQ